MQGWNQLKKEKVDEYSKIVAEGIAFRDVGKYGEAQKAFTEASKSLPDRPDAYKEEALVYFQQKDFDGCIEYIKEKSQVYKENLTYTGIDSVLAELDYILGTAYYEKLDYKNAAAYLDKAVKRMPQNQNYYRDLAVYLAKDGRLDDAQRILDTAIKQGLADDATSYVSGEIALIKGMYEESVVSFLKAIDLTENEEIKKRAFLSLAELYKKTEQFDSEIKILERAQTELKEKDNIVILEMLGNAYTKKGLQLNGDDRNSNLRLAVTNFEKLIVLGYKRSYVMRNIGILYQQIGDFGKAEEALLEMGKSFPDDYKAYMQLAFLYADMESRKDNALRDYSKTKQNYEEAEKLYKDAKSRGVDDTEMKALEGLINELKDKKWIE